jgi:hypothetical protein
MTSREKGPVKCSTKQERKSPSDNQLPAKQNKRVLNTSHLGTTFVRESCFAAETN